MKEFSIGLLLVCSISGSGFAADSLLIKNFIGPPELVIPPPVDPAVTRKLVIGERLNKTIAEQADLKERQTSLKLRTLLQQTETAYIPSSGNIGSLEEALSAFIKSGDLKNQSLIYSTLGVYYGQYGQPDKAIYYFTESIKIKEKLKDQEGIGRIAANISALYKSARKYNQAIIYADYVVSANQILKNTAVVANTYLDIASMKFEQEKYKECEYYILRKAFPLFQRTGNKIGRMNCFQSLAGLYSKQNRLSEAKWFYLQTQIMSTKLHDVQVSISSLTGLASVKYALGETTEAFQDYHQAERLALQNNYLVNLVEINASLGEMYRQLGDYPAAGAALDSYSRFRTSWLNSNKL